MNFITKIHRERKNKKKSGNNVFFITTMTKCDETNSTSADRFGSIRTVGFRNTFEKADEVVRNNVCDIYEYCYEYACIEELGPELYPEVKNRWFYKFNREKDMYELIDTPNLLSVYENFAHIG